MFTCVVFILEREKKNSLDFTSGHFLPVGKKRRGGGGGGGSSFIRCACGQKKSSGEEGGSE